MLDQNNRENPDDLTLVKRLSKEVYSLDKDLSGTKAFGANIALQSFIQAAAFQKTNLLFEEKWLTRISVDSSLNALSFGLAKFKSKIHQLSTAEQISICEFILETNASTTHTVFLEQLLLLLVKSDECLHIFSNMIQKMNLGYFDISQNVFETLFDQNSKLLSIFCDHLSKMLTCSTKKQQNSWMIKKCSFSSKMFTQACDNLIATNPSALPEFVELAFNHGNALTLYPPHEQPCVMLARVGLALEEPSIKELNDSKLLDELFQLYLVDEKSAVKVMHHFPFLVDCLLRNSGKHCGAQRISIKMLSNS